ncbi:MAG TPA: protein kinase [Pseudomonadota bacterium]|nr:protein kinase [Pseudomonadota bacterium]HNK43207.1 protein kinase [Pseudomonadota bacterium]
MTETAAHNVAQNFDPPPTVLGKYCPSCHSVYLPPDGDANFCAKDGAQLLGDQRVFGGKYVLGEPLGYGHMSEVYVATQAGIGRRVALKLLRSEHRQSAEMRKRFEREAQIASSLDHPNAVTIFDSGHTSDGQSYIAMELLGGETLDRLIQREAPMPLLRALELLIPAVRALAAAHTRQIIHRDVKPDNIFVARKPLSVGAEEVVKVLDFGIARVLGRKTRVTSTQTALGTPHYMAPETLQGDEASPQSDVFAVGVILTEMLTKKLPWGETSRSEVSMVMARMVSPPLRLTELLPGTTFPPDLQPALDQFLSQSLENRPVDCAVALQILIQFLPSTSGQTIRPALPQPAASPGEVSTGSGPPTLAPGDSGAPPTVISSSGATRPLRMATAVLTNGAHQTAARRARTLAVASLVVAILTVLWGVWLRKRPPPTPSFASQQTAQREQAAQKVLFVPEARPGSEPAPVTASVASAEPADAVAKKAPSAEPETGTEETSKATKTRRHRHRAKPAPPKGPSFPLDTKGY